uniref:Transmembrane protein n=1 Tax=Anopheles culicifacies TaxID=139723 RepID=A0A182MT68_9DIPT
MRWHNGGREIKLLAAEKEGMSRGWEVCQNSSDGSDAEARDSFTPGLPSAGRCLLGDDRTTTNTVDDLHDVCSVNHINTGRDLGRVSSIFVSDSSDYIETNFFPLSFPSASPFEMGMAKLCVFLCVFFSFFFALLVIHLFRPSIGVQSFRSEFFSPSLFLCVCVPWWFPFNYSISFIENETAQNLHKNCVPMRVRGTVREAVARWHQKKRYCKLNRKE